MSSAQVTGGGAGLGATPAIESEHPVVLAFARKHAGTTADPRAQAVALYYAVRDGIRYDAYGIDLSVGGLKASTTLAGGRGWCVSKAILLAAVCRAQGIPARLGFADVRNHLSTARMRETMQTDVFYWHGYTAIHLHGVWVKATPAFNVELCERFRIRTLEFDGQADSIYHPFDLDGREHMEYLAYRGEFDDVPLDAMTADFRRHYPGVWAALGGADFDRDVAIEVAPHGSR